MPSQVIDVEDADFASFAPLGALDLVHPPRYLGFSLLVGSCHFLQRWAVQMSQRRAGVVYVDIVLGKYSVKRRSEQRCCDVAPLVPSFVRACSQLCLPFGAR